MERKLQRLASLSAAAKALMSSQATGPGSQQTEAISPRREHVQDVPTPWDDNKHAAATSSSPGGTSTSSAPHSSDCMGPVWWTSNSNSTKAPIQAANASAGSVISTTNRPLDAVVQHSPRSRMHLSTGPQQQGTAEVHAVADSSKHATGHSSSTASPHADMSSNGHKHGKDLGSCKGQNNSSERNEMLLLAMQQIQQLQQLLHAKKAAQSTAGSLAHNSSNNGSKSPSTLQEAWAAAANQGKDNTAYLDSSLYTLTAPQQLPTAPEGVFSAARSASKPLALLSPAASAALDIVSAATTHPAGAAPGVAAAEGTLSRSPSPFNGGSAVVPPTSGSRRSSRGSLSQGIPGSSPAVEKRASNLQAGAATGRRRSSNNAAPTFKANPPPPLDVASAAHVYGNVYNNSAHARVAEGPAGSAGGLHALADDQRAGTSCESHCEPHSLEDSQIFGAENLEGQSFSTAAAAPQAVSGEVGGSLAASQQNTIQQGQGIGSRDSGNREKDDGNAVFNEKLAAVAIAAAKAALTISGSGAASDAAASRPAQQGQQQYMTPAASQHITCENRRELSKVAGHSRHLSGVTAQGAAPGMAAGDTASHYSYTVQAAKPAAEAAAGKIAAMQTAIAAVDQAMQERRKSLAAVASLLADPEPDRLQAGGSAAYVDTLQDLVQQMKQLEQTKQKLQLSVERLEQGHAGSASLGASSAGFGTGLSESISNALKALQDQNPAAQAATLPRIKSKVTMDYSPFPGQPAVGNPAAAGRGPSRGASSRNLGASQSPDEVLVSSRNNSFYGSGLLRRRRSLGPDSGLDTPVGAVIEGYANIWSAQRSLTASSMGSPEPAQKHNISGSMYASGPSAVGNNSRQVSAGYCTPSRHPSPYRSSGGVTASPSSAGTRKARRHSSDDGQHHKTAAAAKSRSLLISKAATNIRSRAGATTAAAGAMATSPTRNKQQKLVTSQRGTGRQQHQRAGAVTPERSPSARSPPANSLRATGPVATAQAAKQGAMHIGSVDKSFGTQPNDRYSSSQQYPVARSVSQTQHHQQAVRCSTPPHYSGSAYPNEGFFLSREHSTTAAGTPGWSSPRTSSSESKMLQLMQVLADFQAGEIPEQDLRASLELVLMSRGEQQEQPGVQQQQQQLLQSQAIATTTDGWQAWQRQQQHTGVGAGIESRPSSRPSSRHTSRPSSMFGRQLSKMLLMVQDLSTGGAQGS